MTNQEFAKLWEAAIIQYNATIGLGNSVGKGNALKPRSIGELLEMVEREHGNFLAFRERQAKFRVCLKYALAPVEMLGFLASDAASIVSNGLSTSTHVFALAECFADRHFPQPGRSLARSCFCWVYVYLLSNHEVFSPR